jgi:hypothetical protein
MKGSDIPKLKRIFEGVRWDRHSERVWHASAGD